MHTVVSNFSMVSVASLDELLEKLKSDAELKPFAGGTDLMVELEAGMRKEGRFVDINSLSELRYIKDLGDAVEIGALATYTDIVTSELMQKHFPLMVEASRLTAAPAIQNRGTIGGNVVNASPAADTPPALLVYDATIIIRSQSGERKVAINNFYKGYKNIDLQAGEIVTAVVLLKPSSPASVYHKIGTRKMQAISKVVFAGSFAKKGESFSDLRLAFGSVAPFPLRAVHAENYLNGKKASEIKDSELETELFKDVVPIDDIRSEASYRKQVAFNIVKDFLERS
jgi:CO/xanthine dehydrogenase FAD-binding subunit